MDTIIAINSYKDPVSQAILNYNVIYNLADNAGHEITFSANIKTSSMKNPLDLNELQNLAAVAAKSFKATWLLSVASVPVTASIDLAANNINPSMDVTQIADNPLPTK